MRIAVIAANGRTGRVFVNLALAAGHQVRAGIYKSDNLPSHPQLTVVECDATRQSDLANLIEGQDAVVSFIGHVKGSPENVQTDAIRALNSVMKAKGIYRLVSLTGTGVRFPGDKIPLIDRVLNAGIGIVDPKRIKDGENHVRYLQETALDWTVLRVLKLQDMRPRPFSLKLNGPTKIIVSREEVAQATLTVLEERKNIREAPIISKP